MTVPPPWSDQPITGTEQDCFSRSGYAQRAADLIVNSRSRGASAVFGLTGPWGSGKTSLIEMMLEKLRSDHQDWSVARFTPWSSADVPGLMSEFYASLIEALPPDRRNAVKGSFATLLQIAAPVAKLIPLAGDATSGTMLMASQALAQNDPWVVAFEKTTQKLRDAKISLLVVADDVDRLQADELVALLKVVRLLGRFPGVQYILAYDDHTLTQTLSTAWGVEDGGVTARSFMEKIVQYPLVVPPLLDHQLLERFDSGVDRALEEAGRPAMQSRRLGKIVDILPALLPTPRAIDRLLAQLRYYLVLLDPEDINDEDVILLTLVRTAFPRLYGALPRWKTRLILGQSDRGAQSASSIQPEPPWWEQLFEAETVPPAAQDDAKRLLTELFPKAFPPSNSLMSGGKRRICEDNYFDRYFAMSILPGDVSDVQVLHILSEAKEARGEELTALLTGGPGSKVTLAINKAAELVVFRTSAERFAILSVLSGLLDRLDDTSHLFESNQNRVILWMAKIITPLDQDTSAKDLSRALSDAPFMAQFQVWDWVTDSVKEDKARPSWVADTSRIMGDAAIDRFVEHLREGDNASTDEYPAYYAQFARRCGRGKRLREEVAATMTSSGVTLEALAARMVPTRVLIGIDAPSKLGNVDQNSWAAVAPDADDPWYQNPPDESVDLKDLSWANRRRLSRGQFKRPNRGGIEDVSNATLAD